MTKRKSQKKGEKPTKKISFWKALIPFSISRNLAKIDKMSGSEFEEYMMHLFKKLGYGVEGTPITGDQGADIILVKKSGLFKKSKKIAVQVKRYSGNVSNKAVQEVVAAKAFYQCTDGLVVTNSYFTASAIELAKVNGIELIDRDKLKTMI